jgi:23S rRNA (uracil1939-C5)-methyltransferase
VKFRSFGVREATVAIDRLAYGGAGFGRIEGKACFVPFTAPGDCVRVRTRRETASYLEADVMELLESSLLRTVPPCPVFSRCGGCHWQHLDYSAQIAAKEAIFSEALWRHARVERELLLPPLTADEPWSYRARVQVKLYGRGTSASLGFFASGSHVVVDLPGSCAVAHPAINNALRDLKQVLAEFPEPDRHPQIDLAAGDDGAVVMTVHYTGDKPVREAEFWCTQQHRLPSVAGVSLQRSRKATGTALYGVQQLAYTVPASVSGAETDTLRLSFSAGSFSQVNYRQNQALVRTALEWGNLSGGERILDLCCGNGNFSLPFAGRAGEVVGLETGRQSVADARNNAAALGIGNARFEALDGGAGLRRFISSGEQFELVIIDPPRSGASEMAGLLGEVKARAILYVSCDPQTLGRDLTHLQQGGYQVVKSRVVDMFPQTYHIESITLLERV